MSEIANALRKQREFTVKVGKFTFTVLRPTDVQALALYRDQTTFDEIASRFVINWGGVTLDDIKGGGGSTIEPPFDQDDWREWVADRPDFWQPIAVELLSQYASHTKKAESISKN